MKKFYITTSIPYTNAPPHIGFALEIIQADVVARHHRKKGEDVFFLTGTDEHGLKTKKAAEAAGVSLETFLNETAGKFKQLKEVLNVSTDDFIRTTDESRHIPTVIKLWKQLDKNGDLNKKKYEGLYCAGCEAFKTSKEMVDGKCIIHQTPVEKIAEENYFFTLSKYKDAVRILIENDEINIIPKTKKNEVLEMLVNIDDVSFSRSKDKYAGIPVPGDENQIMYVWADALPNYISAIGYESDAKKFKKYWPADVHCIGPDIVKFHAIYWPAMLLSLGLKQPKNIFVHGFITSGNQKMSKSLGNVVDPFELVQKYGVDAVRYYLLREITPTEDGDFTYEKFEQRYNAELAGGIGNLVARVLGMAKKIEHSEVNTVNNDFSDPQFKKVFKETDKKYEEALEQFKFNEALALIWELISFCDKKINEEKLWETKNAKTIENLFLALEIISTMLDPFLPSLAEKIKKAVTLRESEILFPRIDLQNSQK